VTLLASVGVSEPHRFSPVTGTDETSSRIEMA
jgi:hypothetical protein